MDSQHLAWVLEGHLGLTLGWLPLEGGGGVPESLEQHMLYSNLAQGGY